MFWGLNVFLYNNDIRYLQTTYYLQGILIVVVNTLTILTHLILRITVCLKYHYSLLTNKVRHIEIK